MAAMRRAWTARSAGLMRRLSRAVLLLAIASSLTACGGGGSTATAPGGGTPGTNTATLEWDAVNDPNLAGYRVYVGLFPGSYAVSENAGLSTTYTVTGLGNGTYYFAVTAYDASLNESVYSDEVSRSFP